MREKKPIPIFVGGCNRSGTTMMGAMLGSHSDILCVPEAHFILQEYQKASRKNYVDDTLKIMNAISSNLRFKLWGLPQSAIQDISEFPRIGYEEVITELVKQYGKKINKSGVSHWVDHVPANIKYTYLLLRLFPEARFIHIVRDGRAVAASLKSVIWGPKAIDRAAIMWIDFIAHGLAAESKLGTARILRITYESLVQDPRLYLSQICEFIGIEFQEEMIMGRGFVMPQYYRSNQRLVGQIPDVTRITAWQRRLPPRDIEIFEFFAGGLLSYFGYLPQYYPFAKGLTTWNRIRSLLLIPIETIGIYLNRVKVFQNSLKKQSV